MSIKKGVDVNGLPSFSNIKKDGLRHHNRGAIMANIYEIYKKSYDQLLYSLEVYMSKIPKEEHEAAKHCMCWHLRDRGYKIER